MLVFLLVVLILDCVFIIIVMIIIRDKLILCHKYECTLD
jgi:hypothetical protein